MVYYVCKGDTLEKYEISFDKKALMVLREEVINKCSYITHEERTLSIDPALNIKGARNVVNRGLNQDYYRGKGPIYSRYSYDIFKEPYLATIIVELINSHMEYLYDLDNPYEEVIDWEDQIAQKRQIVVNSPYPEAANEALRDLKLTIEKAKLNAHQENPLSYYDQVKSLITRKLVATISIEDATSFAKFWNIDPKTYGPVGDGCIYGPKRLRHKKEEK